MLVDKIYKKAAFIILPMAALSALIEPRHLPIGIIMGGVLGIYNFRGLNRGLANLLGTHRPAAKLTLMGIGRLLIVFSMIILLAVTGVVNLVGLLVGFTVVLILLLIEGVKASRQEAQE